ncbi:hypothetical protein VKT23_007768 [Stygiomarasmius scandens]|uniref:AIG1-type G domain-containing protein n=1 Tax=Marasmiellus scandens TaxID=2682957 RepID=A0ABR1JJH5_9AGAR
MSQKTFNDPTLDGKDTDIVIPIMGATGAGKSTFINYILGEDRMEVGHHLTSCTEVLAPTVVIPQKLPRNLKDHRVVIVDTPGFDDTHAEDVEILRRIATWLEKSYRKQMVLGGVIYLHDISQDRFTGTARRNLTMFNHLCGDASLKKVILVTTKWEKFHHIQHAERRETELKEIHWKYMMEHGTEVCRFMTRQSREEGRKSAWEIIDATLRRVSGEKKESRKKTGLQIQKELVEHYKMIPQTEAGKQLHYSLQEFLKMQKQMADLEADIAKSGEDPEAMAKLQEMEETIRKLQDQIQSLKVSLPQRIRRWIRKIVRDPQTSYSSHS